MHKIGGHPRQCIITISNPAVFDRYVLTLDITHVGKPAAKRCIETHRGGLGEAAKIADHWHRLRLRARRERPSGRRATDERDELAPSYHSITLSARARKSGVTASPIASAAFMLTTKSSRVGCSIGRSAGLAPPRSLSTKAGGRGEGAREMGAEVTSAPSAAQPSSGDRRW